MDGSKDSIFNIVFNWNIYMTIFFVCFDHPNHCVLEVDYWMSIHNMLWFHPLQIPAVCLLPIERVQLIVQNVNVPTW